MPFVKGLHQSPIGPSLLFLIWGNQSWVNTALVWQIPPAKLQQSSFTHLELRGVWCPSRVAAALCSDTNSLQIHGWRGVGMIHRLLLVRRRRGSSKVAQVASAYISKVFPITQLSGHMSFASRQHMYFFLFQSCFAKFTGPKDQIQWKGEHRQLCLLSLPHSFEEAIQCFINNGRIYNVYIVGNHTGFY